MVWKYVNISDTGTGSKFGADDTDKINRGFSGIDVDDYDINSDFKFRDGKLQLSNPANTFKYTINTSAILADRSLIVPLITGTDTLAVLGLAQTFSNKTLDATCVLNSSIGLPATVVKTDAANVMGEFDTSFPDNRIRIYNPAGNFRYTLIAAAIGADRNLTLPLITGPDTLAALNMAQTFTQAQTISVDASPMATLYRPVNTANATIQLNYDGQNSISTQVTYARASGKIITNTNSNEEGDFNIFAMRAGALTNCLRVEGNTGGILFGPNLRCKIDETNVTSSRTYSLPNVSSVLIGSGSRSGAVNDINATAAETDMLSYSVGSNQLGANGSVRFKVTGYILANSGAPTYTFAVTFGGTTMWRDVSPAFGAAATKFPFRIVGEVYNKNATNAQGLSGSLQCNDSGGATTGIGNIADDTMLFSGNFDSEGADTTKDTTSTQTLAVTVTMSVNNSAVHTVVKYKEVDLVTSA